MHAPQDNALHPRLPSFRSMGMTTLLPPPSKPVASVPANAARSATYAAIDRAVDRTVHIGSLFTRIAVYGVATAAIHAASFGPSFLFGALLGDLLGSLAQAKPAVRRAPVATVAEIALLLAFTVVGATQVGWPVDPEMRSLLLLAAFATASARLGWAFGDRDDRVL